MLIHSLSTSVSNLFLDLDFSDPRYQNELLAIEKRNFSYNSIVIDRSRRIRINFLRLTTAFARYQRISRGFFLDYADFYAELY